MLFSYAQLAVLAAWFVCGGLFNDFPGEFPFELFFGICAEVIFDTFDFPYVSSSGSLLMDLKFATNKI